MLEFLCSSLRCCGICNAKCLTHFWLMSATFLIFLMIFYFLYKSVSNQRPSGLIQQADCDWIISPICQINANASESVRSCGSLPAELTRHFIIEYLVATAGILLNLLIIYFVLFKTPKEMSDYRQYLFMIAVRSSVIFTVKK